VVYESSSFISRIVNLKLFYYIECNNAICITRGYLNEGFNQTRVRERHCLKINMEYLKEDPDLEGGSGCFIVK
jgi:hypothetical protein